MEILNEFRIPTFQWTGYIDEFKPFYYNAEYNDQFIDEWNDSKSYLPVEFRDKLIGLMKSNDIVVGHIHRNTITRFFSNLGKWLSGNNVSVGAYFHPKTGLIYIPTDMGIIKSRDVNWLMAEFLLAHEICHYLAYHRQDIFFKRLRSVLLEFYSSALSNLTNKPIEKKLLNNLLNALIIFENNMNLQAIKNLEDSYYSILGESIRLLGMPEVMYQAYKKVYDTIPGIRQSRQNLNQFYGQETIYPSEVICTFHSHIVFDQFKPLNKTITSMLK